MRNVGRDLLLEDFWYNSTNVFIETIVRPPTLPPILRADALVAASFAAACRSNPAPPATTVSADTWAVVDGREITRDAVEKAYRRARNTSQTLSDEEALMAKLSLLNDLVLQDILLAKAGELKVDVPAGDLDTATRRQGRTSQTKPSRRN